MYPVKGNDTEKRARVFFMLIARNDVRQHSERSGTRSESRKKARKRQRRSDRTKVIREKEREGGGRGGTY